MCIQKCNAGARDTVLPNGSCLPQHSSSCPSVNPPSPRTELWVRAAAVNPSPTRRSLKHVHVSIFCSCCWKVGSRLHKRVNGVDHSARLHYDCPQYLWVAG